jgi:hypothetical protein
MTSESSQPGNPAEQQIIERELRHRVSSHVVDLLKHRHDLSDSLLLHWVRQHLPVDQINEIRTLATAVLDDEKVAASWLTRPNPATDGRPPLDILGEHLGFERVKNLLLRIEYGVLA